MPAAKLFGEPSRLIQMFDIANMGIYFEYAKEKLKLLFIKKIFRSKPCLITKRLLYLYCQIIRDIKYEFRTD